MNPVKVLKPGSRLICLRDLSNKRHRPSSALSSSFSSPSQTIVAGEKRTPQSSSSSSSTADADNDEGGGGGGEGGGGEGGGGEAEMKTVCFPVVAKSPVPAATPVGARPLSLRVVTSTVADCEISRTRKRDHEDSSSEPSTAGAPLLTTTSSRSSSSSGKTTTSTPSPNTATNTGSSHHQMAAAAADDDAAGEDTTSSGQDSPTASPSKQLNKLKRFLKTIHHLGSDISVEIGELVRSLVLRLVNNNISIEEFHEKLHKATNFPLRPFVIPFLKSTLPILQQELLDQAELHRLSPHQYLARNEHLIFHTDERTSTTTSPPTTTTSGNGPPSIGCLPVPESVGNGAKRRHSDRKLGTNGVGCIGDELSPAPKRPRTRPSPPLASERPSSSEIGGGGGGYVRIDAIPFGLGFAGSRPIVGQPHTSGAAAAAAAATRLLSSQLDRELIQRDRERYFSNYNCHSRPTFYPDTFDRPDDEWKYVEHLLKCIVGMVDKCQRALVVLQERSMRSRDELTTNRIRRTVDSLAGQMDIKRYVSDFFSSSSHDFQPNEEQRVEALRSAEESMKDFRLQAVVELQKAVAASEAKAREMLAADRVKMEQALEDVRRKTRDEITCLLNKQEDSDENCWNCGRMASQTCSGCNVARYCGAFCQHRHWESHHRVCGRTSIVASNNSSSTTSSTSSSSAAPHHHDVLLPRSTRLSSNHHHHHHHHHHPAPRDPASSSSSSSSSSHPGIGAAPFRSRSRTKSLSPVLLQTTKIKQETL